MIKIINHVLAVAFSPSRQPLANLSGQVITRPAQRNPPKPLPPPPDPRLRLEWCPAGSVCN
jgi:hypothetical protein